MIMRVSDVNPPPREVGGAKLLAKRRAKTKQF